MKKILGLILALVCLVSQASVIVNQPNKNIGLSNGSFTAVTSAFSSTATNAITQYGITQNLTASPTSASQALFVSIYGLSVWSGTSDFSGGGHLIGGLFEAQSTTNTTNHSPVTPLIGVEGRYSNTALNIDTAIGTLGSLGNNATGKTITTWNGLMSQVTANTGTITNFRGVEVDASASLGTIGEFRGFNIDSPGGTVSGNYFGNYVNTVTATVNGAIYANHVADQTAGVAAAGYSCAIGTGSLRYCLYQSGSAQNYLQGRTTIGTSIDDGSNQLQVTGNSVFTGSVKATSYKASNLLVSSTAPTISSGFGTSPSISANNGTAAFRVSVGTGGTASSGVIGLPAATTGWNCYANDVTTQSSTVFITKQTASTTTSATIGNYNTSGAAAAWSAGDVLAVSCFAY